MNNDFRLIKALANDSDGSFYIKKLKISALAMFYVRGFIQIIVQ